MPRESGKVKWFSDAKGYGFIESESGDDVFVHHTSIEGNGYKTLSEGERVEYEVVEEPKGRKARDVVRLDAAGDASDPRRDRAIQSPMDHKPRR